MISQIEFPNTVEDEAKTFYIVGQNNVKEIRPIMKAGEMSGIQWFQIIDNDSYVLAEIKESICNVYYKDKKADEGVF